MSKELEEIKSFLNTGMLDKPSVLNAMVNLRMVLDEHNLKEKYKYLNLYCNWMVHKNITLSMTAFRILEYLTDSMIAHNEDPKGSKNITAAIVEGFNLHKVQLDILEFGKEFDVNVDVLRVKSNWQIFAGYILTNLVDRSLKFSEGKMNTNAKKIYDSIVKKANDSGLLINGVIEVTIINFNNSICFRIRTLDYINKPTEIMGHLPIITQEMVDANN
jgi:hypothetical protein